MTDASAAAKTMPEYTEAQKRVYDLLAKEGGGTWATYMMIDIEAAFASAPPPEGTVEDSNVVTLSHDEYERFIRICENPPKPTEALRQLLRDHGDNARIASLSPAAGATKGVEEIAEDLLAALAGGSATIFLRDNKWCVSVNEVSDDLSGCVEVEPTDEQREIASNSPLSVRGKMALVWMNEEDIRALSLPPGDAPPATGVGELRDLVQTLIDEEPDDSAADGGVTVLMVWRQRAQQALARIEGGVK